MDIIIIEELTNEDVRVVVIETEEVIEEQEIEDENENIQIASVKTQREKSRWRIGASNSKDGRERILIDLAAYPDTLQEIFAVWGDTPTVVEPEPEPPDTETLRTAKLNEISEACERVIHAGIDIETSIGLKHFNLSSNDQINLMGCKSELTSALLGLPSKIDIDKGIWYKADGVGENHRYWSVEDFMIIVESAFEFKAEQLTYCDMLKSYTRTLQNISDIEAVYYGMELPGGMENA